MEERASSPVHAVPHSALPQAFPEKSSGPRLCPRLQLRGSAGVEPASLSSSSEEDARTYFRKLKKCTRSMPTSSNLFPFQPQGAQGRDETLEKSGLSLNLPLNLASAVMTIMTIIVISESGT